MPPAALRGRSTITGLLDAFSDMGVEVRSAEAASRKQIFTSI
jgi:hypothetical protein